MAGRRPNYPMSYEPTESGFSETTDDQEGDTRAILTTGAQQHGIFQSIQAINPHYLQPFGRLPEMRDPRTHRYRWQLRTPEGILPRVWCRMNACGSNVVFEVTLPTNQFVAAHVPIDSWRNSTCDAEAVRAAIQRAYLNLARGIHPNAVIVTPRMKSLQLRSQAEYGGRRRNPGPSFNRHVYPTTLQQQPYRVYPSQPLQHIPQYTDVYYPHHRVSNAPTRSPRSSHTLVTVDYGSETTYYDSPQSSSRPLYTVRDNKQHYVGLPPPHMSERHMSALSPNSGSVNTDYSARRDTYRPVRRNSGWSRLWSWG